MKGRSHLLMKRSSNLMKVETNKNEFITPLNVIENKNRKSRKRFRSSNLKIMNL